MTDVFQVAEIDLEQLLYLCMKVIQFVYPFNDFLFLELQLPSQNIAVTKRVVVRAKEVQICFEGFDELVAEEHVNGSGLFFNHSVDDEERPVQDNFEGVVLFVVCLGNFLFPFEVLEDGGIESANLVNEVVEAEEGFF